MRRFWANIWRKPQPGLLSFYTAFFYVIIGLLVLGPVVFHPFTLFIGGPGDPQQFMWYLGWFWHAVSHGQNPFHTTLINAPAGQNLMWNTSIFTEAFLFGPLTWLFNATFTYNLLWLGNFVLSCILGEKILKRLGVRNWLAVWGGLLTGMLPYTTSQSLFHIHLWTTAIILAIGYLLIVAHQSGVRRPVGLGLALGLLAVCEFYTSIEVFATLALTVVILLILTVIVRPRKFVKSIRRPIVVALVVTGVVVVILAAPGIYEMFRGPNRPHGALLPAGLYVNDLLNFFLPTLVYLVHSPQTNVISAHYTGNFWENNGYLGIPAMLLFLYSAKRLWCYPAARVAVYASVIIAVLSMGPVLHINGHRTHIALPWVLLQKVPLIESALPSRLMFYADIFIVMLLVRATEDVFRKRGPGTFTRKGVLVLLALVLVSWFPRIPYPHTATPIAAAALGQKSSVRADLLGHVTYLLTPGTPETMQAIVQGGYPLAMVNPYGYTDNKWQHAHDLVLMAQVLKPNLTQSQVKALLWKAMPGLHATRLLYFPLGPGDHLTLAQYNALTDTLGAPLADDHGAILWNVPDSLGK
jgi:hypothetical protein